MKKKLLLSSALIAGAGLFAASEYFFKMAMTPFNKKADSKELSGKDPLYRDKVWFRDFSKKKWTLKTDSGITLFAQYLDQHAKKTAILLHGFMSDFLVYKGVVKLSLAAIKGDKDRAEQIKRELIDIGYEIARKWII